MIARIENDLKLAKKEYEEAIADNKEGKKNRQWAGAHCLVGDYCCCSAWFVL